MNLLLKFMKLGKFIYFYTEKNDYVFKNKNEPNLLVWLTN